uniref:Uncharacterized protein n=1 Tax=Arundo donax TaxID=35708 RepID=A0A0A9C6B5_ARUDO
MPERNDGTCNALLAPCAAAGDMDGGSGGMPSFLDFRPRTSGVDPVVAVRAAGCGRDAGHGAR